MPLQKDNGFTLVELMIAMLLLTFGLLSAITLETACIQGNSVARRMDEATGLAQAQLEQLRIAPNPVAMANVVEPALNELGVAVANGPYRRVSTISAGPTAGTRRVQVDVTWTTGPGNRRVSLVEYATGGIE